MNALRLLLYLCLLVSVNCKILPILLWHGMGDTCCLPFSMGLIKTVLKKHLNGTYVHSVEIGSSTVADYVNSLFMHPNKQIEIVCRNIQNDPKLKDGFNAIGFSQGAQFIRGLIQKCPDIKPFNLISIGGQHQGVYGLPKCDPLLHLTCDRLRRLISSIIELGFLQSHETQAAYWHDPLNETAYRKSNTFLTDINNEIELNQDYIERLHALNSFLMVKFRDETTVIPKDTEWFQFYEPGQSKKILAFGQNRPVQNLQLDVMYEAGKIRFMEVPGDHLAFDMKWFQEVIDQYLI